LYATPNIILAQSIEIKEDRQEKAADID